MIWTDDFLNQLAVDAEQQINQDLQCVFWRFFQPVQRGLSVYTLPSFVRSVRRITWLGRGLDAQSWEELQYLTPATVFVAPGNPINIESTNSRPLYYALHPTNPYDIRLYPTPDQTFDFPVVTAGDPYSPVLNELHCTISVWRAVDSSLSDPNALLPNYIDRRTRKAYVCWRAFAAEGPGQNLKASRFYKMKYDFLIEQFIRINSGTFVSKRFAIEDGMLAIDGFRYPRPTLNPNFERTIF